MNRVKTWVLIAALGALFVLVGGLIWGPQGLWIGLVIGLGFNLAMYWFSAKIAPPPSSHDPPYTLDAPTTRSNRIAASVGAAGTNDRNRGWSTEMQAGPSTSA